MAERTSDESRFTVRDARDAADMQGIMAVRHRVFVVEQAVTPNAGADLTDRAAYHVVGLVDNRIVGAGRLHIAGGEGQIAWVAVLPEHRRLGVGRAIMRRLLELADQAAIDIVLLNAQAHALRFYRHLGFQAVGQPFMMGGIEHQLMSRVRPGVMS